MTIAADITASHGIPATALIALLSLALACGALSLVVVWRRWAFMGEGIAHAGFGGAGTAWMIAAIWPSTDTPAVVGICVILFCLATALAIGAVHRAGAVHSDTAIGAFLAGALAWGFLGQQLYFMVYGRVPAGFTALLFGENQLLTSLQAQMALSMLMLTAVVLILLRRQILLYCFEPELAQTAGVRTTVVHYVLTLLVALAIIVGVRLIGSVLVTAMLILPGASAMLLTRRLYASVTVSTLAACAAVVAGMAISMRWPALPQGPLIVLSLFALFIASWTIRRFRRE